MGSIGWFLPILIASLVAMCLLMGLIDQWTQPKSLYGEWLGEKLKRNTDYIRWLENANSGRDYKLGLRILKKIKKGKQ